MVSIVLHLTDGKEVQVNADRIMYSMPNCQEKGANARVLMDDERFGLFVRETPSEISKLINDKKREIADPVYAKNKSLRKLNEYFARQHKPAAPE